VREYGVLICQWLSIPENVFVMELGCPGQKATMVLGEMLKGRKVLACRVLLQPPFAHDGVDVTLLKLKTAAFREAVAQEHNIIRQAGEGAIDGIDAELGSGKQENLPFSPVFDSLGQPLDFPHAITIKTTARSSEIERDFVHAQEDPAEVRVQTL